MRVVFLYTSDRCAPEGSCRYWDPNAPSTNFYAVGENGLPSEGYLYLLKEMLRNRIIDDFIVFIESARGCGHTKYGNNYCYVVPEIGYVKPFLRKGDVIWARGGFRSWFKFLTEMKGLRWLLLYAANTGRARWKFWDIVFDDLSGVTRWDVHGRFFYDFKKPINPNVFKPLNLRKEFDVCIGASHVHDRKAQWKTVEVVSVYKKLFGETLRCVLPGRITHGVKTNNIKHLITQTPLDVVLPGMVSRDEVCRLMNKSRLFVYLGQGGQNDRGPLESLSCGTPVLIANTRRHSPVVYESNPYCTVVKDPDDIKGIAYQLREILARYKHEDNTRELCSNHFSRTSGVHSVILPEMKRIFDVIRENPNPNIDPLKAEYGL